jgi:hypothetical protein
MLDSIDSSVIALIHETKEIFILQPCGHLTRNKKLIFVAHFSKVCNQTSCTCSLYCSHLTSTRVRHDIIIFIGNEDTN